MYPLKIIKTGTYKNIFKHIKLDQLTSHIFIENNIDALIISNGSMVYDCLDAIEELFMEHEISLHLINPFKIYPFNISVILDFLNPTIPVFIIEEGTVGGSWCSEIISLINLNIDEKINCYSVCSNDEIIPSSRHLEEIMLVNKDDIRNSIIKNLKI